MSHSVERHLSLNPTVYDAEIRRFIPEYDEMLDEVTGALAELVGKTEPHFVDLGAGTGSLSERIALRFQTARLTLVDADPAMLKQAESRLQSVRARLAFREQSFADPLPACDAAVAAFSLHHVPERSAKLDVYRNVARALVPGGVLVSADAMVPASGPLSEPLRRRWADHLVAHGHTQAEAFARFAEWAKEDFYYSIAEELAWLREAGFATIDVRWRKGPTAVVVAIQSA